MNCDHGGVQAGRGFLDFGNGIAVAGFAGGDSAPLTRQSHSGIHQIGGDDSDAAQSQQAGEHQANRPLADDEHVLAPPQAEAEDGFENGVDRLQHGALFEGIVNDRGHKTAIEQKNSTIIFDYVRLDSIGEGGNEISNWESIRLRQGFGGQGKQKSEKKPN
jgi:hypothetical protein